MLGLIAECVDADVVLVPDDPEADDPWAATPEETNMSWTLGHVIVHTTASSEESAALAAEMARGVALHGRSRYEVPWQEMRTIEGCRQRLEESRRMRLASLEMWPDDPHLENVSRNLAGRAHGERHRTVRAGLDARRQPPGTDRRERQAGPRGARSLAVHLFSKQVDNRPAAQSCPPGQNDL